MRAVILAMGDAPGIAPMNERYPGPLVPLVDRPFIQHLVEYLAAQGITRFDFVLSHLPEKVEHHLGDGRRWGSTFTFHLVRDPTRPYRILKVLDFGKEGPEPLLLGHADRLPAIPVAAARTAAETKTPLLFACTAGDVPGGPNWTGWAIISPAHLNAVPNDADENAFWTHVIQAAGGEPAWFEVPGVLDLTRFDRILEAHRAALDVRLRLRTVSGSPEDVGRTFPLPAEGVVRIAPEPRSGVRLADPRAAAVPCELHVKEAKVTVLPAGGEPVPLVNGKPAAEKGLMPGDVLRVGDTELRLELSQRFPGLFFGGREVETGVWLSRNVALHPTVQIYPPVYVGENCTIGPGVRLGPNTVVGNDCMLDGHSIVTNAVVFPGSYVGEGVEVAESLVDKNRLIIAHIGEEVVIKENFILGSMSESHVRPLLARTVARLVALLLLVPGLPVLLATAAALKLTRPGPVLHRRRAVRLPAPDRGRPWHEYQLWSFLPPPVQAVEMPVAYFLPCSLRGLLLGFLPGLVSVVRGDLNLVGVPPRPREAVEALGPDWKALYLRTKAGLVTEAANRYPAAPDEDEAYAADAFYAVTSGWGYDVRLLGRYLGRALFGGLLRRRVWVGAEAAVADGGAAVE
jgi:lipopolysaccharide/colanic/teichoic acid biosynthesis glycosyltransferase